MKTPNANLNYNKILDLLCSYECQYVKLEQQVHHAYVMYFCYLHSTTHTYEQDCMLTLICIELH
jgi:hypothetical protein